LLYALLTGLAAVALSDTAWNGDKPIYEGCELEAQGKRDLRIQSGQIIVEDSSTYHCSFGMYTEEMKFSQERELRKDCREEEAKAREEANREEKRGREEEEEAFH
jgi:hypothetical protein